MQLSSFEDLLSAAAMQPTAQRLLMVFAGASLPADASAEQRAQFEAGHGGELAPLMCVDKLAHELSGFAALAAQADQMMQPHGAHWQIVFISSLSGSAGMAPSPERAEAALQTMVDAIKQGRLQGFIAFNRDGVPVNLIAH